MRRCGRSDCRRGFDILSANYSTSCSLDPPLFAPSTLLMPENAPVKTLLGSPLQASLKSPDFQLSYSIVAQYRVDRTNAANSTAFPQTAWPFAVDSCSGQVSVLSQVCSGGPYCALFDFENDQSSVFAILVRVSTTGPAAFVERNVTVQLTNIDEPPFCLPQSFTLPENAPRDTTLGTLVAVDHDTPASALRYSLVIASSTFGAFTIDNTTARISVASGAFDFENIPPHSQGRILIRSRRNRWPNHG